jgi:hypothetical protein
VRQKYASEAIARAARKREVRAYCNKVGGMDRRAHGNKATVRPIIAEYQWLNLLLIRETTVPAYRSPSLENAIN